MSPQTFASAPASAFSSDSSSTSSSISAPVLIIHTGDPNDELKVAFGNYAVQLQKAAGLADHETEIVSVFQGHALRAPSHYRAVLITGSPTMVTDQVAWSEQTAQWLREAAEAGLPMFGVCYGHQLLSYAFGGKVGYNPNGKVAGTMAVTKHAAAANDALLQDAPESFAAHMLHTQVVLEPPPGAVVLGSSPKDPYHMLKLAPKIYSTQFHPEFSTDFVKAHLTYYTATYRENGIDATQLCQCVKETPQSIELLRRFLRLHA